nr:hypothetical protein [Tanacetum cinerariifolium]
MLLKKLPEKLEDPDFVVVDFEADLRVSLILGRSFLRIGHALIDVYGEEITLRVNDESITFNLNQTMRYSSTYDDTSVNRVDVIDVTYEDFVQDVLDFQYNPKSSNHTLVSNDSISKNDSCKEKSSIEEPPDLELKDLPSHLEYAFLEDSNKLPVIIAKNLKVDEREALLNDLKSYKRAIAWKISDIKGIDPRFCTHKILIEDDYKPAVQSQRRLPKKLGDPGKFLIPCDSPRMEEITLSVNDESVTFNLNQVMRYSDNSVSRVNVINIACEEFTKSSSPTLVSDSSISESDFFLEEIENFLKDDSIPTEIENSVFDPKGDILLIEKLLNEDPLTELVKVAESSAKNLVPIQSEYEVSESNEPIKDDSFLAFTTFINPLFNDKDDFTYNDNESIHDEDIPMKESIVYSNPLFDDDEIHSNELESHCLNVESNFIESLSNHDTLKFDFLKEFSGALMPIRIADEERIRKEHAEYISLMERLITINLYPQIDIVTDTDELLPPGFENDDSKGEIYVLEELRVDNFILNSKSELSDNKAFDFHDLLFPRPPPEPPDAEFDFEPNSGEEISAVMNNIEELIDDEWFDPGEEIDIFVNVKDDDYFPFRVYPSLIEVSCVRIIVPVHKSFTSFV